MNKTRIQITLDMKIKKEAQEIIASQDKKLSAVVNTLLRKYIEEYKQDGNNTSN